MSNELVPWAPQSAIVVPPEADTASEIASYGKQLRPRDVSQIVSAFDSKHYEIASIFVWAKAMAALRTQLGSLGPEFIGEMLQRPDIDEYSDINSTVTESEAISLAEDLGIVNSTDALRLRHCHELIAHFASLEQLDEDDESEGAGDIGMNPEEAVSCLRTCIQTVLGHPKLDTAQTFANFRRSLEERTFTKDDDDILGLTSSPYFHRKTTLSVLLALLKTCRGAQLEHVARNVQVIVPILWPDLLKAERWQTGQTYAELHNEGKTAAVRGLKAALVEVKGFDFVPENLRSNTYTRAAKDVLKAHEGSNNFYNEPGPMRVLASLGTGIPGPAFPTCMTAIIAVRLGNRYGHSWAAQSVAEEMLDSLSTERWVYFLEGCLPSDRTILYKLTQNNPRDRWLATVSQYDLGEQEVRNKGVAKLLEASAAKKSKRVGELARKLYTGTK